MKSFASIIAVVLGSCAAVACTSSAEDTTSSSESAVIGAADAALLEQSFELRSAGAPITPSALESGDCFKALMKVAPEKYALRLYAADGHAGFTSAAAFSLRGSAQPMLCLDLYAGDAFHGALSGVALDAVARYDLGRFRGDVGEPNARTFQFERGALTFELVAPDADKAASVQKTPAELPPAKAMTIAGALRSIDLPDVQVDTFYDGVKSMALPMDGAVAGTIYAYAWKKGKESGTFSMANDSVGTFTRTAEWFGDGPGMSKTWHFTRMQAQYAAFGEELSAESWATNERIAIGESDKSRPLAECTRRWTDAGAVPEYTCTGFATWACGQSQHAGKQYWTCSGDSAFKCEDGNVIERACDAGCERKPTGTDDQCKWSCDRSDYQGRQVWTCNGTARYRCESGVAKEQVCANGCRANALGTDDECLP